MKIFSNFFKGRDAPINRTFGSAYSFFMGGLTSGKRVNKKAAQIIKNGGYTTSLTYVDKLCIIIERYYDADDDEDDYSGGSGDISGGAAAVGVLLGLGLVALAAGKSKETLIN